MAGLLAVFAEFERDVLRERVKQESLKLARWKVTRSTSKYFQPCKKIGQKLSQEMGKLEIARRLDIGRTSVRRVLLLSKKSGDEMDDYVDRDRKQDSVFKGPGLSLAACLFLVTCVFRLDLVAEQPNPVKVVKLAAETTRNAVKSASLRGTYEVLDEAGNIQRKMRMRIRFSGDKYLTEMDTSKGFRYDRVVAVADQTGVCESAFSNRQKPFGCKGELWERTKIFETGGIGNGPVWLHQGETPLWLQGPLVFCHILGSVPFDNPSIQVKRTKDGRYLGRYRHSYEKSSEFVQCKFETRPEYGDNFSRLSLVASGGGRTVSLMKWKQSNGCWFIEEFKEENWFKEQFKSQIRIQFDDIQINKKLPPNLFSIASLGLADGTRILDRKNNQRAKPYNYVPREPQQGDTIRGEATRQKR